MELAQVKKKITQQKLVPMKVLDLQPYANNSNTHSDWQIKQIGKSIKEFGFTNPVLVDDHGTIVAGHGRVLAAYEIGLDTVPTINLGHLSHEQRRAYVIADNQLARLSSWDRNLLATEALELKQMDFDVNLLGFDDKDLDGLLDLGATVNHQDNNLDLSDGKKPKDAYDIHSCNEEVDTLMGFKTAISREETSAPMRHFIEQDLLDGAVLDFGAGMDKHDYPKYDPYYDFNTKLLKKTYDTITCNYVLNVQAHAGARLNTLLAIRALLKEEGRALISVMTSQDNAGDEQMVRSRKGFQVYYTPDAWRKELAVVFKVKRIKAPFVAWECRV